MDLAEAVKEREKEMDGKRISFLVSVQSASMLSLRKVKLQESDWGFEEACRNFGICL